MGDAVFPNIDNHNLSDETQADIMFSDEVLHSSYTHFKLSYVVLVKNKTRSVRTCSDAKGLIMVPRRGVKSIHVRYLSRSIDTRV